LARVNFTPDDVARTRISAGPAPLMETELTMLALRRAAASRRGACAAPWLLEAMRTFPPTARPLLDLVGPRGPSPNFLDCVSPDLQQGLEEIRATPPGYLRCDISYTWDKRPGAPSRPPVWVRNLADGDRESLELVVRALRDLHDAVVAPRWDTIVTAFHADVAKRIGVLATGGSQALFDTLHPRLRWRDQGLDRAGNDLVCDLRGDGILLMPSASWAGEPMLSVNNRDGVPNVLLYAAQPNGHPAAEDGTTGAPAAGDSLAALLGPTRAAALRALRQPLGTAELAAAVGISPASASEHAKVLRDAYLIETRREGRAVRHSLTALGRTILGQLRPADARIA
jgi:DNA-binding transcriptional ArsR family regulator